MSGPLRIDLHVHSQFSPDSTTPLEAYAGALAAANLNGFALTDHNTIEGHARLDELRRRFADALFLPGVEVSTREGHLLVYGTDRLPPSHAAVDETVEWAEARGAVAVPAHPFRWSHGVGRRVCERIRVPSIEAVNGHNSPRANERAVALAAARRLAGTGGSDAHDVGGLGRAATEFPDGVESVADVLEALRRGRCRAVGRSLTWGERLGLAIGTAGRRATRGFRPI